MRLKMKEEKKLKNQCLFIMNIYFSVTIIINLIIKYC